MRAQVGFSARRLVSAAAILVLAVGAGACGDDDDSASITENADIVIDDSRVFDPTEITIDENKEVTITVANTDDERHNFTVSFVGIDQDIEPGQRVDVKIPATTNPSAGFLSFYCEFHQSEGEQGRIKLES